MYRLNPIDMRWDLPSHFVNNSGQPTSLAVRPSLGAVLVPYSTLSPPSCTRRLVRASFPLPLLADRIVRRAVWPRLT